MSWIARHKIALGAAVTFAVIVLVAGLVVYFTMNGNKNNGDSDPWVTNYRLPKSVIPSHYNILLNPNLEAGTFTGFEDIDLEITEDQDYIVVHAKYLEVDNVSLRYRASDKPNKLDIEPAFEVPKNEWWVIKSSSGKIPSGNYTLHINFSGLLTRNIVGFYRSSYRNAEGAQRYIATSKFEPTYARYAFPCFDEPAMKATFSIRLVRPSKGNYTALSNTDVKSEIPDPTTGLTTVEFHDTKKMSTYLAVFIVSDFVHQKTDDSTDQGIPVKVYARKEQIENAQTALEVAVHVSNYYVEFFKIPYPMPKIDLIAIPDFVSGAMENWGLITFRETSMLFDPNENSPSNQERVSSTVAHELAHMWFGNLVTMKWWTDLWLNEGFATFMSFKGVNHIHPEWDVLTQFLTSELHPVLKLDAALSSHPILQEVGHPDQITEIFDTISYNKGASLIRMLESFLGETPFANALNTYLKEHEYNNAETNDLWRAMQKYAPVGVNVSHVMSTWTLQMGLPLVKITKSSPGSYTLTQKRFLADPKAEFKPSESPFGYKWDIPITYSTSASGINSSGSVWLKTDSESVNINVPANTEWIKVNNLQTGYYRVLYEDGMWKALSEALIQDPTVMEAADRANLINDAFSLADAQTLNYDIALNLSRYLKKETHVVPWTTGANVLDQLDKSLSESTVLKKYGRSLVDDIYKSLTWSVNEKDDHQKRLLRVRVLSFACSMQVESALQEAQSLFMNWLESSEKKPHQDVRLTVYQYGMAKVTDEKVWDELLAKYQSEPNAQEKVKIMFALAQTPSKELLKRYMELAKNESVVRSQDYFSVLSYISENPEGTQLVWDFYRNEWEYLVKRFSLNDRIFGRFIISASKSFQTEAKLKEVQDFFEEHPDAGAGAAARKQAVETIKNNIKWVSEHKLAVEKWLNNVAA